MRKLVAAGAMALGIATLPLTAAHAGSTWQVGLKASKSQVVAGHKIVFTGTVRPKAAAAGHQVVLQEKYRPGKPWEKQRMARVAADGTYRLTDRPTTNFTHAYRVVMPATRAHQRGVSATVKIKVYAWGNLTDREAVNNRYMSFQSVDMNGTTYKHSVVADYTRAAHVEFNLDHDCTKLKARFGISDDSTTGGQAEVDVLSDGTQVYTNTFDLGQSEQKTVHLDNPLKLRLQAQSTSTGDAYGYGAFGTASILCTR